MRRCRPRSRACAPMPSRCRVPFADLLLQGRRRRSRATSTSSTRAQLAQCAGRSGHRSCQQIVPNRYPFTRGSTQEVPLADFGRLFGPERHHRQVLQPEPGAAGRHVEARLDLAAGQRARPHALARDAARVPARGGDPRRVLRDRRQHAVGHARGDAADAREPAATRQARDQRHGGREQAGLERAGAVPWPGAGLNRTAITVAPDTSPQAQLQRPPQRPTFGGPPPSPQRRRSQPSVLERSGAWSLFRMLDGAARARQGDWIVASFIVGGRELQYQFGGGSVRIRSRCRRCGSFAARAESETACAAACSESCRPSATSSPSGRRASFSTSGSRGCRAASRRAGTALGDELAAGVPDRADLALLARRGTVRHDRARRVHVVARRRRALLSADAVRLSGRGRGDPAAGTRCAGRLVRGGRGVSALDARGHDAPSRR